MDSEKIEEKILNVVSKSKIGISTTELAKKLNTTRLTLTKYLEVLRAKGLLTHKQVGMAKLWMVRKERKKPKVLVVEDDENILRLVGIIMKMDDYEVVEARDGIEAIEKVNSAKPDLIVLDLMLPKLNGEEVFKRIRNNPETMDIPVIMLTAKRELKDRIGGIKIGAEDYLTKPFNPSELRERVKTFLRREESERHPITSLPFLPEFRSELKKENKDLVCVKLSIENLEAYASEYGGVRKNEFLKLLSQVILHNIGNRPIAHIDDANIVIALEPEKVDKILNQINEDFKQLLPYVYDTDYSYINIDKKIIKKRDAKGKLVVMRLVKLKSEVMGECEKSIAKSLH